MATVWSLPPARLAELALPRFFGDPSRLAEGLFFGWSINDRNFPYVTSLYPSLLVTVLALCALARWPIPHRGVWVALAAAGLFVALGRHNPAYEPIRSALPFLSILRYPEKFVALTTIAMTIAGALGWSWLLEQRAAGRRDRVDFPLVLSSAWLAICLALTLSLYLAPQAALWHIRTHGTPELSARVQAAGLALLRREGWASVLVAAGVVSLLALCRWHRPPQRVLALAALALVAADLWRVGHSLVETSPVEAYRKPPKVLRPEVLSSRLWVPRPPADQPDFVLLAREQSASELRSQIERLAPFTGLLWGVEYGFNVDFDLTLTRPAKRAAVLVARERDPERAYRLLGAWNVGNALILKPPEQLFRELRRDREAVPVEAFSNTLLLPRFRLIEQATLHPETGAAERAAVEQGFDLAKADHWIREGTAGEVLLSRLPGRLLSSEERGALVRLSYRAEDEALLVAAITYDLGWRARVDGLEIPVRQTAIGQLGIELPAGEHNVELRYREPSLRFGAAVSALSLLACTALLARSRRILPP
jgi:hypothetical protein